MKSESIYLTVRVDISFPDTMDEADAVSTAVENFDYDFKMKESYGITVDDMEICDVNQD